MLICNSCGWQGSSLQPDHRDNTARCPKCNSVFIGIQAKDARYLVK